MDRVKRSWRKIVCFYSYVRLYLSGCRQYGHNVYLSAKVKIRRGRSMKIGTDVHIGAYVQLLSDGPAIQIGARTVLLRNTILTTHGSPIVLGEDCSLNHFSIIYGGARIGSGVRIGAHVVIIPHNHVFKDPMVPIYKQGSTHQGVDIEDDVWIGAHVTVTDGVRIGRGSVIGAGAVVTKDIPPYSVAVGVPAKVIRSRLSGETREGAENSDTVLSAG
jgi:acetyltransferase-like isoleucine patch superfamily enzyme